MISGQEFASFTSACDIVSFIAGGKIMTAKTFILKFE